MGLFGNNNGNSAALTPPGVGGALSADQMNLFTNAAQQSGLTDMAMQQVDMATGGLKNEDQVQLIYHQQKLKNFQGEGLRVLSLNYGFET